MSKTSLVVPIHKPGPLPNGADGCHTRANHPAPHYPALSAGMCCGVSVAEWLNSMGPDDAPFGCGRLHKGNGELVKNIDVRRNWTRDQGTSHVRFQNPLEVDGGR